MCFTFPPSSFYNYLMLGYVCAIGYHIHILADHSMSPTQKLKDKFLAGRRAIFEVTVNEVFYRSVPELDDTLANEIRPESDAETIKKEVRISRCRTCSIIDPISVLLYQKLPFSYTPFSFIFCFTSFPEFLYY